MYVFADDTKIYSEIKTVEDCVSIQDLNNLKKWTDTWLQAFHPKKCKVLSLGNWIEAFDDRLGQTPPEHTDRSFRFLDPKTFLKLYKSLVTVRPHLIINTQWQYGIPI